MSSQSVESRTQSARGTILVGLFAMAMGAFPLLIGLGVMPASPGDAPPWIGLIAGGAFLFAGAAVVIRGATRTDDASDDIAATAPNWLRTLYRLLGLATVAALASIGTWVALGPGVRHFTASIPFVGTGPANETLGRVLFGIGAAFVWMYLIAILIRYMRNKPTTGAR